MQGDGYVVLPVDADFADASPQLEFVDEDDSELIAVLSYSFAGQQVGSTDLVLSENDLQEYNFHKVNDEQIVTPEDTEEKDEPKLVKINLKIVALVSAMIRVIGLLVLLIIRISREYTLDLSFLRRLRRKRRRGSDRNSFSSQGRKRYRSKKLRRHKRRR